MADDSYLRGMEKKNIILVIPQDSFGLRQSNNKNKKGAGKMYQ